QKRLEVEMGHRIEVRLVSHVGTVEDGAEGVPRVVLAEGCPVDLVAQRWRTVDEPEIAFVNLVEQAVAPELLQQRLVVPQGNQVRDYRLVGHDELAGTHRAIDGALDALLEIGDQIARVAAEDLIASLPTEHDLAMLGSKL